MFLVHNHLFKSEHIHWSLTLDTRMYVSNNYLYSMHCSVIFPTSLASVFIVYVAQPVHS